MMPPWRRHLKPKKTSGDDRIRSGKNNPDQKIPSFAWHPHICTIILYLFSRQQRYFCCMNIMRQSKQ